ncbi:MAG: hypothetical protein ACK559_06760, partial [bacterium]
ARGRLPQGLAGLERGLQLLPRVGDAGEHRHPERILQLAAAGLVVLQHAVHDQPGQRVRDLEGLEHVGPAARPGAGGDVFGGDEQPLPRAGAGRQRDLAHLGAAVHHDVVVARLQPLEQEDHLLRGDGVGAGHVGVEAEQREAGRVRGRGGLPGAGVGH